MLTSLPLKTNKERTYRQIDLPDTVAIFDPIHVVYRFTYFSCAQPFVGVQSIYVFVDMQDGARSWQVDAAGARRCFPVGNSLHSRPSIRALALDMFLDSAKERHYLLK